MMEWINVKDRLPETTNDYLTCCRGKVGGAERWIANIRYWYSGSETWSGPTTITHWMPLPAPPKAKKLWDFTLGHDGHYVIHKVNEGQLPLYVNAELLCAALNGTAEELLEFAGVECACDKHGPYYYQRSEYKTADGGYWVYQIVDNRNNPVGGRHVIDMLNNCCCKHQGTKQSEATKRE